MSENYASPTLIQLVCNYANILLIIFFVSGQEEIMLQDLIGAPDEFEMLDLVHPLVWIWREQQVESAVHTFSETL